jgi:hypothetical protein
MRTFLPAFLILLCLAAAAHADQTEYSAPASPAPAPPAVMDDDATQRVEIGGLVLDSEVYRDLAKREDGWQIIERLQSQVEHERRMEGVPHLVVIFFSVLLFFCAAMVYYQRKHARLHQTLQLMIEKGQPVPVDLLRAAEFAESGSEARSASGASAAPAWASNLLWGGVLWVFIGATAMAFLWLRDSDSWPWGLAAVAYGLASMVTVYAKRRAD